MLQVALRRGRGRERELGENPAGYTQGREGERDLFRVHSGERQEERERATLTG